MKSKSEVSAGGLIYRRVNQSLEILIIKDHKGNWTFPKGLIEEGEDPVDTAKREVKEEVGLDSIEYIEKLSEVKYNYIFKGTFVRKKVFYYLFKLRGSFVIKTQKEEGITEASFYNINKVKELIGYKKTNEPLLTKTENILSKASKK